MSQLARRALAVRRTILQLLQACEIFNLAAHGRVISSRGRRGLASMSEMRKVVWLILVPVRFLLRPVGSRAGDALTELIVRWANQKSSGNLENHHLIVGGVVKLVERASVQDSSTHHAPMMHFLPEFHVLDRWHRSISIYRFNLPISPASHLVRAHRLPSCVAGAARPG